MTHLTIRDIFINQEPRLFPYTKEKRMELLHKLDLIFLFQYKVQEVERYIEIYIGGSPLETINGEYDLVYKLLFNNILIGFENLVEIYQKIDPKKYKKDYMSFEDVNEFGTENWMEKENIFKTINFLRRMYVHSEGCTLKDVSDKKFETILDEQAIYFKNDLQIKFSIYDEKNKEIIGKRSCNLQIIEFLKLIYNEIFNNKTSWENIFQKLENN